MLSGSYELVVLTRTLPTGKLTSFLRCKVKLPLGGPFTFYTRPRMMACALDKNCIPVDVQGALQEMDSAAHRLFYGGSASRA